MRIINLLPREKQKELVYRKTFRAVIALIWFTAASFAVVLLVQFAFKAYLQGEEASLKSQIGELKKQASKEENAEIKNRVKVLNDLVADYKSLSEQVPKFSKVLRAFAPLAPEGVSINSMKIDAAERSVDLTGYSPTRELVIKFYDNMVEANADFPNIDYPLENVARPVDIAFHFTFNINPELLK